MKTIIIKKDRLQHQLKNFRDEMDTKFIKSSKKIEILLLDQRKIDEIIQYKDIMKIYDNNDSYHDIIDEIKEVTGKSVLWQTDSNYKIKKIVFETMNGLPSNYDWGTKNHETEKDAKDYVRARLKKNIASNDARIKSINAESEDLKALLALHTDTKDLFDEFEKRRKMQDENNSNTINR